MVIAYVVTEQRVLVRFHVRRFSRDVLGISGQRRHPTWRSHHRSAAGQPGSTDTRVCSVGWTTLGDGEQRDVDQPSGHVARRLQQGRQQRGRRLRTIGLRQVGTAVVMRRESSAPAPQIEHTIGEMGRQSLDIARQRQRTDATALLLAVNHTTRGRRWRCDGIASLCSTSSTRSAGCRRSDRNSGGVTVKVSPSWVHHRCRCRPKRRLCPAVGHPGDAVRHRLPSGSAAVTSHHGGSPPVSKWEASQACRRQPCAPVPAATEMAGPLGVSARQVQPPLGTRCHSRVPYRGLQQDTSVSRPALGAGRPHRRRSLSQHRRRSGHRRYRAARYRRGSRLSRRTGRTALRGFR